MQDACRFHTRDQAIIEVLLQTGIRLSELTSLKLDNVELPARAGRDKSHVGAVHLYGKGRRARAVSLNWKACQALKSYLSQRGDTEHQEVFLSKFGEPLGPRAVQELAKKHLTQAGIRGATVTRIEYLADLGDLLRFLVTRCGLSHPARAAKNHLESYLAELDRRGLAGSTRRA